MINQTGQLDLSSLVASEAQNEEVQIENEGCVKWKRKKGLDGS
jgi:hypothetical protein